MRIASKFGERTTVLTEQSGKQKIYLIYEGEKTEVQYFNALINKFNEEKGDKIFEIIPLLRSYEQRSNSHPKNILEQLDHFITSRSTYAYLKDILIDYFVYEQCICDSGIYTIDKVEEVVENLCNKIMETHRPDEKIKLDDVAGYIEELYNLHFTTEKQLPRLVEYIKTQTTSEMFTGDKICLIIDYDHNSLRSKYNYQTLLDVCKENGVELYISNPNFEFWLLLHSKNIDKYDPKKLKDNKHKNGKKRGKKYLEELLSNEFKGYKKNDIKPERFMPLINTAIKNEKAFCEDPTRLNAELGTNVGKLVATILGKD